MTPGERGSRLRQLATPALFVALSVVHTWPLATAPATLTRHDNADTFLNQWILAWVTHALPRQPLQLFEANIFHPEPHTLAFSEHLVVQGLMGAPLAWLGASPVLVYNLVLLAGLSLTAWATAALVTRWTGDWTAGLLAGSVAAFNTHTLTRYSHIQASHVEFLPLALLAFDRLLASRRVRDALALGLWSALQMLCSGYLLVLTAIALATGALVRLREWMAPDRWRRSVPLLALAATLVAVVTVPFLLPYAALGREQHLVRSLETVAEYSATGRSYLATAGTLHFAWWSHRYYDGTQTLFPGVVPLALALVTLASGLAWRDPRARMVAAAGLVGFACSFGPAFPPYGWLYAILPPLQGLRNAARFGYLTIFAVGVLAGYGLARIRRAPAHSRPRAALGACLATLAVVVVNLEALTAPRTDLSPARRIPAAYAALADDPRAIVVELPFWPVELVHRSAEYVFDSTAHWRPIVNGYSGLIPDSYARHAGVLQSFPDEAGVALLRDLGVTHVVVHAGAAPDVAGRLHEWPGFEEVVVTGTTVIFRLQP